MSLELLPQFITDDHFNPHIQGFAAGVLMMLLLDALPGLIGSDAAGETVLGKVLIHGLPIFSDGLLVGTLIATGFGGIVIIFAITIEQTFVGLAAAATFARLGRKGIPLLLLILLLAGILASGVLIGGLVIAQMSEISLDRVIGMATSIMLYVVVEEMLIEAREEDQSESLLVRLAFFGGFLLPLIIE
jgi:ZIP family zinc transporter